MVRTKLRLLVIVLAVGMFVFAGELKENVALNKSYTFSVDPNYHLCTDEGDLTQLTDGLFEYSWALWAGKGTVGWHSKEFVHITIDLEKTEPISGLMFRTAAGTSGVILPEVIHIFTSEDGKGFYYAGDLLKLCDELPKVDGYYEYKITTNKLKTKGRYVRLFVVPNRGSSMKYIFIDEIEVYRGPEEYLKSDLGKRIDNFDLYVLRLMPW